MSTHLSSPLIRALATPSADAACDWATPMRTRAALADLAAPLTGSPARAHRVHDGPIDFAGDVADEDALCLASALAFLGALFDIGLRAVVAPHALAGDGVERAVRLSVAAAVQAVALDLAAGRFDRRRPAKRRGRGLPRHPLRVVARGCGEPGGAYGAAAAHVEQRRRVRLQGWSASPPPARRLPPSRPSMRARANAGSPRAIARARRAPCACATAPS